VFVYSKEPDPAGQKTTVVFTLRWTPKIGR
jgi:hypothetical protein